MVILVVDQFDIRSDEPKGDTPVSVDPDRPVPLQLAFEWMETESGQVEIIRHHGHIEQTEKASEFGGMSRLNAALGAGSMEALKSLVAKADNHTEL